VWEGRRGAATIVKGPAGTAVLTDAGLVAETEEPFVFYAGLDGKPVQLKAKVMRRHAGLGLAELELEETRHALRLAEKAPAVGDLTSSLSHLQIGGLWTRTSGLVAKAGEASFHTDAAISPEMIGAPVLNEDGGVAGVLSLRKSDNEDGVWPVGVPAPLISRWLAGEDIAHTAPPPRRPREERASE
jgi:S1-C subfamily serine protease